MLKLFLMNKYYFFYNGAYIIKYFTYVYIFKYFRLKLTLNMPYIMQVR